MATANDVARRCEEAVAELRSIHTDDPAARRMLRTIKLTIHTLEEIVIPTLDTESL